MEQIPKFYCMHCGSFTHGKLAGSGLLTIVLLCCYLLPGLIYELWRYGQPRRCKVCRSQSLMPSTAPAAKAAREAITCHEPDA